MTSFTSSALLCPALLTRLFLYPPISSNPLSLPLSLSLPSLSLPPSLLPPSSHLHWWLPLPTVRIARACCLHAEQKQEEKKRISLQTELIEFL
eukprot:756469-Hanusia_phi.AAC.3